MVAATIVRPFYFRKKNAATETAFSQKPLTYEISKFRSILTECSVNFLLLDNMKITTCDFSLCVLSEINVI